LKKRCPGAERGRDARVIDEVAHESFDALTLENEDNGLFRKEDAVAPKAGQSKPVRRPFGDNLGCSLPRVWKECRNDRYALILVPGLPTKEPPHYSA
jgi:hypothetical protein